MPQIDAEGSNEVLKKNAEAEYTSKAVTKKAAPNTGSEIPHQHHSSQNKLHGENKGENKGDGHHHHHGSKRDVSGSSNIIGNHFKIGRRIGEGSFGIIYDGK